MSPFEKPLASVTHADLLALVPQQICESTRLDFKTAGYEGSREYAKDVVAFANSKGGILILGATETDTALTGVPGYTVSSVDEEQQRLVRWAREVIEPPLLGVQVHVIDIGGNRIVTLIEVPESFSAPHRATTSGNKFYVRHQTTSDEATYAELKMMFNEQGDIARLAREFLASRVEKFTTGQLTPSIHPSLGAVMLHVIPHSALVGGPAWSGVLEESVQRNLPLLREAGHNNSTYSFDGYMRYVRHNQSCGHALLFHNGTVEAIAAPVLIPTARTGPSVHLTYLANEIAAKLPQYVKATSLAQFAPPYYVVVSLLNIQGATLLYGDTQSNFGGTYQKCDRPHLLCQEIRIDQVDTTASYMRALRPVLEQLWHAAGAANCTSYNASGDWVLQPVR